MINVSIFVYGDDGLARRLELFEDENISINSSIQNVNDISKVFTDFDSKSRMESGRIENSRIKSLISKASALNVVVSFSALPPLRSKNRAFFSFINRIPTNNLSNAASTS